MRTKWLKKPGRQQKRAVSDGELACLQLSADSITLPEFWVWKLTESGPAEIARKVGNLPEFWVWKLPEIKASFFAAALKKLGIFFMLL